MKEEINTGFGLKKKKIQKINTDLLLRYSSTQLPRSQSKANTGIEVNLDASLIRDFFGRKQ